LSVNTVQPVGIQHDHVGRKDIGTIKPELDAGVENDLKGIILFRLSGKID
jgi:hypothetical protein